MKESFITIVAVVIAIVAGTMMLAGSAPVVEKGSKTAQTVITETGNKAVKMLK